ncbi:outer membrane protein assembly factor BamB family protein [Halosimplex amylolyticum]|uniref:outer membrane protein assembly factor BamB family protein n=1 Tax=Halosimplex amylolyticum TaxID=3396616 RepID=UPI003F55BB47
MPTRRRALALSAAALASLTGCLGDDGAADREPTSSVPSSDPTATPTPAPAGTPTVADTDAPGETDETTATRTDGQAPPDTVTRVSGDLPTWRPDRWIDVGYANVLGLDADDRRLYVTANDEDGDSAVAALSPGSERFDWQRSLAGDPEAGSHAEPTNRTDKWGVTVADGTVYSVNGRGDDYEWTAVHALDAATGTRRWSVERDRRLAVHGFVDDAVVVGATEFFEPESTHDTPEEPLETVVSALDTADGDERWSTAVSGLSAVTVGADGVYVASGRTLSGFGPAGERRWERELADEVRATTALDGVVVAAVGPSDDESSLVGVSTAGETLWRVPMSTRWLVPAGDRVYVMNESVGAVTSDGTVAWRERAYGHYPLLSPDGTRLYTRANVRMNAVDAYDLPGGDRRFRFVTPSNNGWPLAATADTVVAEAITPDEAEFTSLFAVDATSGEPRAVYRPTDTVFTAQGFDGTLYVGFGDGRLGVFETVP